MDNEEKTIKQKLTEIFHGYTIVTIDAPFQGLTVCYYWYYLALSIDFASFCIADGVCIFGLLFYLKIRFKSSDRHFESISDELYRSVGNTLAMIGLGSILYCLQLLLRYEF